jgi:hypothetical protein
MPKAFKIFALLLLTLSLSSCIELVEEITINPDLSGNYHLYLQHNTFEFLFNAVPEDLDISGLERGLQRLQQEEGISKLTSDIRPNKGKFSIQFDFSNAKDLNKAFYASLGAKKRFYNKSFLKVNKRKIKRPNITHYLIKYAETNGFLDQIRNYKMVDYIKYRYRIISSQTIKSAFPIDSTSTYNEYTQLYPLKSLLLDERSTKSVIRLNK